MPRGLALKPEKLGLLEDYLDGAVKRLLPRATSRLLDVLSHTEWAAIPPADPTLAELMVRDCLEHLKRRDRDLLYAYYYERLTYQQIAKRFGWRNKGSAHWHVRQALGRLRERLEKASG